MQEFTPWFIQGFGRGSNPNEALWTISVEILLYVSIPVIFLFIKKQNTTIKTIVFIALGIISYIQNQTGFITSFFSSISQNGYYLIFIHPFMQFFSFFFFFCFGIIVFLHKEKIIPFIANKGFYFLLIYIVFSVICYYWGYEPGNYRPNMIELLAHSILVLCIFSIAYTNPTLTERLIGKTDISYGLYIYHSLVLNSFIEREWNNSWSIISAILICFLMGWLSWILVEKRALKLKKKSIHKI
jgi:peptidoglycan/LPS O-acetylase OafA/YrhL